MVYADLRRMYVALGGRRAVVLFDCFYFIAFKMMRMISYNKMNIDSRLEIKWSINSRIVCPCDND